MKKIGILLILVLTIVSCNTRDSDLEYKVRELEYLDKLYQVRDNIEVKEKLRILNNYINKQEKVVDSLSNLK